MDETGAKIFSNDWKESYLVNGEPLLEHHWGEILGLTEKNMKWLLDEVTSDLYNGLLTYFHEKDKNWRKRLPVVREC